MRSAAARMNGGMLFGAFSAAARLMRMWPLSHQEKAGWMIRMTRSSAAGIRSRAECMKFSEGSTGSQDPSSGRQPSGATAELRPVADQVDSAEPHTVAERETYDA